MVYRVIKRFTDLQDGGRPYEVGSKYPRSGFRVSKERLEELSSNRNRRGTALIVAEVPEETSSEAKEASSKAKEKPRRKQEKHVRTDS